MGWNYNPPDNYECLSCGHIYPFKQDTIWMATHKGRPGFCPKCKSGNTQKTDSTLNSEVSEFDFE